jgi:hypothetical protein
MKPRKSMQGLELSKHYYLEYGRAMIEERFPAYSNRITVGLVGEGSECFGFDDEFSQDHDFGAGFCMWLTDEDYAQVASGLDAAFESLPTQFAGFPRREIICSGDKRIGAIGISDFYRRFIGLDRAPQTLGEWLAMPEAHLAVATNGEVFHDPLGAFSEIRNNILAYYPEDVRLKKLAARIGRMAQAGQYNYPRCVKRGEHVAALHALAEFAENTESAVYLLNKRYKPFYKWAHRGMRDLSILPDIYTKLAEVASPAVCQEKDLTVLIESICEAVVRELRVQNLTDATDSFLLPHAESVKAHIAHESLRALHLFV